MAFSILKGLFSANVFKSLLLQALLDNVMCEFEFFLHPLLRTAVLLVGLIPREECGRGERTDMKEANKELQGIARRLWKAGGYVRWLGVIDAVLEKGDPNGERKVMDGALKDGIHMAEDTVEMFVKRILNAIKYLPPKWFSDKQDYKKSQ